MSEVKLGPLNLGEIEAHGIGYIEDKSTHLGDQGASSHWRVASVESSISIEERQKSEQLAAPLIDNIAETQEVKRALAQLWYESYSDAAVAPQGVRNIAVVDEPAQPASTSHDIINTRVDAVQNLHTERIAAAKARPVWDDLLPSLNNDVDEQAFQESLLSFPVNIREHLVYLRELNESRIRIASSPERVAAYRELQPQQYVVLHNAGVYGYCSRQSKIINQKIADMRVSAHQRGRGLSVVEERSLQALQKQAEDYMIRAKEAVTSDDVRNEVTRRENVRRAEALRRGFVETEAMQKLISVVLPRLAEGLPAAFFGEVGGAKSSLAKHIARKYFKKEPIVVDGGPDISMQSLFGKTGLQATENGGTETYEKSASLTRAAEEGRMVIIDEYDTLPARIRTACNGALLWRVGQVVRPFGLDRDITIKPGFCIVVTANLRSNRYDREKLDLSTLDRFEPNGAGIFEIHYPDCDIPAAGDQQPVENLKLAMAALTDETGNIRLPAGLLEPGMEPFDPQSGTGIDPAARLVQFVNAAHMIQQFFSDPTAVVGHESFVADSQHLTRSRQQGRPVLEQAVLSPRGMLGMLRNLVISGDTTSLSQELARWVSMQPSEMDRKIVSTVLATRGLLYGVREKDLKIPDGTLSRFYGAASDIGESS